MTTPRTLIPEIAPGLPGLPGVPASIGPLRCPTCGLRAATLHHVQDGHGNITPTLACQGCGSIFELEATSYNAGLGAGILAGKARWEVAGSPGTEFPATGAAGHALLTEGETARCECGELFGRGSPATSPDSAGRAWGQHMAKVG